jgi:hypothetical protein
MISCRVEGTSIGFTVRVSGVTKNTAVKLVIDLGVACNQHLGRTVLSLPIKVIECGEIWPFCCFSTPRPRTSRSKHEDESGFCGRVDLDRGR